MKAADLRRGDRFTYVGAFTVYRAVTDAVVDTAFRDRVVVDAVNETWQVARSPIRIRLDGDDDVELFGPHPDWVSSRALAAHFDVTPERVEAIARLLGVHESSHFCPERDDRAEAYSPDATELIERELKLRGYRVADTHHTE